MTANPNNDAKSPAARDPAATLLGVVEELVTESRPGRRIAVTLDSLLERDLGLDSLGRVELLLRIERAFSLSLPEQALVTAETPRDLLRLLRGAEAAGAAVATEARQVSQEAATAPESAATLVETLDWHAATHPDRVHIHLCAEGQQEEPITYGALRQGAGAVAARLIEGGLQPGQSAAIMLPTSRDYFLAFFGVLLAGGIPVPIYPPVRLAQMEEHLRRHVGILSNAQSVFLITVPEAKLLAARLRAGVESLRSVLTVEELATGAPAANLPPVKPQDTAFLQYTSGSTGNPKGVILTHANLLANIRAMSQATQAGSRDVFVSWLPLYHDMGLIGAWLGSLHQAIPLVLMSPLTFLSRPQRWLWTIHRYRGTISAAPNFAYELCLKKIEDRHLEGLDLSCWRLAINAAEKVSPETLAGFVQRFSKYGFRAEAMAPTFGLAECSVGLALPPPGRGAVIDRIQREPFVSSGRAVPAGPDDATALSIVACGRPLPGHEVRIVDAAGFEVGERQEGRLLFRGVSATSGYFRNPEATRRLFQGDWLDSGDLAYVVGNELYITGRAKEIIIRAGRNIYPYELEQAIGELPGIRKGNVAVFGSPDPQSGTERLIVMAETRETEPAAQENLRRAINDLAVELVSMPADDVMLVPPHTVLKTSSGKLRRAACRELYQRGGPGRRGLPAWLQQAGLLWLGIGPACRRWRRSVGDTLFASWAWTWFVLLSAATWPISALLPRATWCWKFSRAMARFHLWLTRFPLVVRGLENLPRDRPCVVVANHSSYVDSMLLLAALPRQLGFVAKSELQTSFIARVYLRRIGAEFVQRDDLQRGAEDAARLARAARAGASLIFYPEGTFVREAGLLPFRMGAFAVAAQAGVPVVPVVIRGTRSMLRDGTWFPRRTLLSVVAGKPILPDGHDWAAAARLRDAVRAEILRGCGEPDREKEP
ncbi:MAG: AMP-binding protein [Verrucomicrobia bacterium]|nr:AMP-binding protein [Verrucomicrobiota bacterium]